MLLTEWNCYCSIKIFDHNGSLQFKKMFERLYQVSPQHCFYHLLFLKCSNMLKFIDKFASSLYISDYFLNHSGWLETWSSWKIHWHCWPDNILEYLKDWRNKKTRFWYSRRFQVNLFWSIDIFHWLPFIVSAQGSKSAQTSSKAPAITAPKPTAYRPPHAKGSAELQDKVQASIQ